MRISKYLAIATFAATLGLTSVSSAEAPRLKALRESARELEARVSSVRLRAVRAAPEARKDSERIIGIVDAQRVFLVTRLDIYQILGETDAMTEVIVRELEAKYESMDKLLGLVESWYRPR